MLDRPTSTGLTHRWTVFVRSAGPSQFSDRSFVNKVVFELHPDFPNPRRILKEPPFEVTEMGYAGFTIPIQISFSGTTKVYKLYYDMNLALEKQNEHEVIQTIEIKNPSKAFYESMLLYGGLKKKGDKNKEKKHQGKKEIVNMSDVGAVAKNKEIASSSHEVLLKKERLKDYGSNGPSGANSKAPKSVEEFSKKSKNGKVYSPLIPSHTLVQRKKISNSENEEVGISDGSHSVETLEAIAPSSLPSPSNTSNSIDCESATCSRSTRESSDGVIVQEANINQSSKMQDPAALQQLHRYLASLDNPERLMEVVNLLIESPDMVLHLEISDDFSISFDMDSLSGEAIEKLYSFCFPCG